MINNRRAKYINLIIPKLKILRKINLVIEKKIEKKINFLTSLILLNLLLSIKKIIVSLNYTGILFYKKHFFFNNIIYELKIRY